ncbi:MAG TPA: formylmethanofuran dehydrogenase subunit A [Stellaceae bacterium]|nr:formylmethanofuran dehydrogenase subunit A [Stellaceae bacterium]
MLRLAGGKLVDPTQSPAERTGDLWIDGDRIVAPPADGGKGATVQDISGKLVMAGAIDIHSHIAGGKVNLGRLLSSADHRASVEAAEAGLRGGSGLATPSTFTTGYRYAAMGYTAAFEPAMVAANARATHIEMADVPILDKGAYVMLGNDEFLLRRLAAGASQSEINDYVAWTIQAAAAHAVKVVNAGGISAFKFGARSLGIDEPVPQHGVTPRRIIQALSRAVNELGVPHPLHVHCNNLGIPGNVETTLATIEAAEGFPIHLTHVQFHSYGTEGKRKFSSAAARIAEAVNANPNVSVDVGQIVFGSTMTESGDTQAQFRNRSHAAPKKWLVMDIECDAGCGLVPFRYRDKNFVNALQWAIGLELFLLIRDPWRVFLTTDHPNGGPFASYPQLVRLLMERSYREECLAQINASARKLSVLGGIAREYTLAEIAAMTRAAPAKSLGLRDRGHLAPGARADLAIYQPGGDLEAMFRAPVQVLKGGVEVARDGRIRSVPAGATQLVRPGYDKQIERTLKRFFDDHMTVRFGNFPLSDGEIAEAGGRVEEHACVASGGRP